MKAIQAFCILFLTEILANPKYANISDVSATFSDICKNDKCVMKCCDFGKYIHKVVYKTKDGRLKRKTFCDHFNGTETTLDANFDNIFINKPNMSLFEVKPDLFKANKTFKLKSIDITTTWDFNVYLNEHAEVMLETPNALEYERWIRIPNNLYCIDSIIVEDERNASVKILKPGVWTIYTDISDEIDRPVTTAMIVGMLVSCFFLALVLAVYAVLPELRNLCGQILMAYVASQLGAFLMLVVMRIQSHEAPVCEGLTYVIYFFFLASFCWLNIMSFDIWWTFRGYAKARPIHRRGEQFKFLMYCLFAFGLPLAMTVMLAVLNNTDMRHLPRFITPKIPSGSCFIKEGEKVLYLYTPMLILILCNLLLYILTAVNIWRLSRGTAVLDSGAAGSSQARRLNRRRFIIYMKLSVVMGLNWVLELLSYTSAGRVAWFIADCYNVLIGVAIFIIFVCKRKIWKKLKHRLALARNKTSTWYPNQEDASRTVTSTDNSFSATQDTNTVPLVCLAGKTDPQNQV